MARLIPARLTQISGTERRRAMARARHRRRRRRAGHRRRKPEVLSRGEILPPAEEPSWLEAELGARIRKKGPRRAASRGWAKPMKLSRGLELRARAGARAKVIELRPGLLIVAEVPDEAVAAEELGFVQLVPALLNATVKTAQAATQAVKSGREARQSGATGKEAAKAASSAALATIMPKAAAKPEPEAVGCERCGCPTCRRR